MCDQQIPFSNPRSGHLSTPVVEGVVVTVNRETVQTAIRDLTASELSLNEDWTTLFDLEGIEAGDFNDRQLAWLNWRLGTNHTVLQEARRDFAADQETDLWNDLTSIPDAGARIALNMIDQKFSIHDGARMVAYGFDEIPNSTFTRASEALGYENGLESLVLFAAADNAPRLVIDSETGEARGYLSEAGETSLVEHSGDFSQPSWTLDSGATVSIELNSSEAPDGTFSMVRVVSQQDQGPLGMALKNECTLVNGSQYRVSVYVRREQHQFAVLFGLGAGGNGAIFDVHNLVSKSNNVNWTDLRFDQVTQTHCRISAVCSVQNAGAPPRFGLEGRLTGDRAAVTKGEFLDFWLFDIKEGAGGPTSAIITDSETNQREKDNWTISGLGAAFPAGSAMWIYWNGAMPALPETGTTDLVNLSDGTSDNRIRVYCTTTDVVCQLRQGGGTEATLNFAAPPQPGSSLKLVAFYDAGDAWFAANGQIREINTNVTLPTVSLTDVDIMQRENGTNQPNTTVAHIRAGIGHKSQNWGAAISS